MNRPMGTNTPEKTSRIPGFYRLTISERIRAVARFANLAPDTVEALELGLPLSRANRMVENVGALMSLPLGFSPNFRIDAEDHIVPMAIEEPSVVAAASNGAQLLRGGDGIHTETSAPVMIGQVQLIDVPSIEEAIRNIQEAEIEILGIANSHKPRVIERGGGARKVICRPFPETAAGPMLIVHLHIDVRDAMGANIVNTMVEAVSERLEQLSGGRTNVRVLSNLADLRTVEAIGRVPIERLQRRGMHMSAEEIAERMESASVFAEIDPYRATTHNKGTMNGVDAVLLATGQDFRAVEAGAHAYAARSGQYSALSTWRREGDTLVGRLKLPMQVGIVGGVVRVHPVAAAALEILGVQTASCLARIATAVGLAQNLTALLALATDGIQRGHMALHARNIAASVGAADTIIDEIAEQMVAARMINADYASMLVRMKKK